MTTLAELVTPTTADAMFQRLVDALVAKGLPARAWQPATVPRTLTAIDAEVLADVTSLVAAVAKGGFIDTAEDAWLTLLAKEVFNLDRKPATAMQRTVTLTAAAGAGPYGIAPGSLWAVSTSGKRFTNTTGTTLSPGSSIDLTFQAEKPGSTYNVGPGTITRLITSLAGVTIVDPDPPTVDVTGTDEETDAALRARCKDRWATLGTGSTDATYRSWALVASDEVTRVEIGANDGAGGFEIYIAGDAGAVSSGARDDVAAYIDERRPIGAFPSVLQASVVDLDVTAQLQGQAGFQAAALAEAETVLTALTKSTPIGGTLFKAKIIERLMEIDGVDNVVLSLPSADIVLGTGEVLGVGTYTLSWLSL